MLSDLTPRAVRYYEVRGLVSPLRDNNGVRRYGDRERRRLAVIARLRKAGLSLEDIRQILAIRQEADGGAGRTAFAVDKLEARRAQLVELQQLTELALAEVTGGALMPKRAQRFEIAAG